MFRCTVMTNARSKPKVSFSGGPVLSLICRNRIERIHTFLILADVSLGARGVWMSCEADLQAEVGGRLLGRKPERTAAGLLKSENQMLGCPRQVIERNQPTLYGLTFH